MTIRQYVLVLACALVGGVITGVYSFVATPLYESSVLLMPEPDEQAGLPAGLSAGLGSIASLAGVNVGGENRLHIEAMATLKSRSFVLGFIDQNALRPILFANRWSTTQSTWKKSPPSDDDVLERFLEDVLVVREDSGDGLVTVSVIWYDPELARSWANLLAEAINSEMRNRSRDLAEASIEYLEQELAKTSNVAVQQAIGALLEKQITNVMVANVRPQYAFRVIDPAIASSLDNPVFPKPVLLVGAGVFLFGLSSAGFFFLRNSSRHPR
ncbi:MAG: Wzz/FepE/Etk N-terminal domain-containing protein [Pseudomonadota bacterium]